jgi:long-chain acyl-CoA synthetase
MSGKSLHEEIISSALANRDKIAFHYFTRGWESLTYGEFLGMAGAFCSRLLGLGVGRGDRVSIVAGNGPGWCASYLGVLMAGGVAVPVDARLTADEMRNILADSESKVVVVDSETSENVAKASGGLDIKTVGLNEMDWKAPEAAPPVSTAGEDDLAALLYTSGTTGSPKAVMLTHGNLLSDAHAVMDAGLITEKDNVLAVLPLHHTYAFMTTFVVPVLGGGRVAYPRGLKGPDLIEAARETGVTVLIGVPQLLELMRNRIMERIDELPGILSQTLRGLVRLSGSLRRRTGINLMKLMLKNPMGGQFRFLASGGARLDPGAMQDLEALGYTVLEGYGLTETSPVVAFNPLGKRKPGSVGKPLPSVEVKILDPSESGEGEIAVRGPMVMKGYYRRPEETGEAIVDGWFRTGDLGHVDDEEYLYVTGRLKEVIVLGSGKNVYPEEVENHYLKVPLIREICVTGRMDTLHAVIVPDLERARAGRVGNISEALKWEVNKSSDGLPPHMRIKGFTLSSEPLPRTSLGKIRRFMVAEGVGAGKPEEKDDAALLADETGGAVARALRPLVSEGAAIGPASNLELDLGLDSLKRMELLVSLERAMGRGLPETLLSEVQTVGELVVRLREAPGTGGEKEGAEEGLDALLGREPSEEEKRKAGLKGGLVERAVFRTGVFLVKTLFTLVYRFEVRGLENLPGRPFIIAANHSSYLDGFVVCSSVPPGLLGSLYFQGSREIFEGRLLSAFARLARVISIDPDARLGNALRVSSHVLRGGNSLFIFPEGGRTFDGSVMPFKKGIGILALKLDLPVVPAWIEGTYAVYPRQRKWPGPGRIRVTFGKPFHPSELEKSAKPGEMDEYMFFADELRKRVIGLKEV